MIKIKQKGNFNKTKKFLKKTIEGRYLEAGDNMASVGVDALSKNTPVDYGETAKSWSSEITDLENRHTINWTNDHTNGDVNIAVILQYGHGTGTGGYFPGIDYINPAMRLVMDDIVDKVWKEATK